MAQDSEEPMMFERFDVDSQSKELVDAAAQADEIIAVAALHVMTQSKEHNDEVKNIAQAVVDAIAKVSPAPKCMLSIIAGVSLASRLIAVSIVNQGKKEVANRRKNDGIEIVSNSRSIN